jgi:hypothetical protein
MKIWFVIYGAIEKNKEIAVIIAAAVKLSDDQIFVGKRHGDAQRNAMDILNNNDGSILKGLRDGFLTSDLKFLEREEALVYAKQTGQFKRYDGIHGKPFDPSRAYDGPQLFSEDLW